MGGRPRRDRPRYVPKRRVCAFCADKGKTIDFRDAAKLRRYISDRGKIESRRKTATCAKHQREIAAAVKRARHLALLPFTIGHVRTTSTPGMLRPFIRSTPPPMMAQGAQPPVAQQPPQAAAVQQPAAAAQPVAAVAQPAAAPVENKAPAEAQQK